MPASGVLIVGTVRSILDTPYIILKRGGGGDVWWSLHSTNYTHKNIHEIIL